MRRRINEVFEEEHVPWAAYGLFSNFHIFTNPDRRQIVPTRFDPLEQPPETLFGKAQAGLVHKFRLATRRRCRAQTVISRPSYAATTSSCRHDFELLGNPGDLEHHGYP
jgi:hypothetical protein